MKIKKSFLLCICFAMLLVASCTKKNVIKETPGSGVHTEEVGPMPPEGWNPEVQSSDPITKEESSKIEKYKDGVVLVMGPGLARSLAFIGVIKSFEEKNIPIKAIVAEEFSAVIASIWAGSNTNTLEWEIHKFKRDFLLDYPFFGFRKSLAEGKKIIPFLEEAVKVSELEKMKIPVFIGSSSNESLVIESSGSVKDILRGTLAVPDLVKAYEWNGSTRQSPILESPLLIEKAKDMKMGPAICLDVLTKSEGSKSKDLSEEHINNLMKSVSVNVKLMMGQCDDSIQIKIKKDFGYLDFNKKADLIFSGKQAFNDWLVSK